MDEKIKYSENYRFTIPILSTKIKNAANFLFKPKTLLFLGVIIIIVTTASQDKPELYQHPPLIIGVAQWRHEGGPAKEVQESTFDLLVSRVKPLGLSNVQVVKLPAYLNNAKDVDAVAAEYEVDVIVWGWYDQTAVRSFVDLANATQPDGLSNSLGQFLENGGSTEVIRVLMVLSEFDYIEDGVYFCIPRWTP